MKTCYARLLSAVALLMIVLCGGVSLAEDPYAALWSGIDGSTATIPLSEALYRHFSGEEDAPAVISHSTTPYAYQNLLEGRRSVSHDQPEGVDVDIIFVTYPSPEEQAAAMDAGAELEIIPVTRDALVLLNNVRNPATGLTTAQLRGIFAGEISNWQEVGGEDQPIKAYQRSLYSGSQTLFLKLLMGEQQPMEPPKEWVFGYMGELVDAVSAYDNAPNALGYSVYYYIKDMYGNDQIRMLAVDGVEPTDATIASGAYPLGTYYYAVLRADTPADHPARQLVAWLLTDEGQRLVQAAGYVPLRPLD